MYIWREEEAKRVAEKCRRRCNRQRRAEPAAAKDRKEIHMRKIALPLILVASLGATSAMAAASTVTGPVAALDAKTHTVTIGKTAYHFPTKYDLSKVTVGEKVTITFTVKNKLDNATKLIAAAA
jgi:hypothetical protein